MLFDKFPGFSKTEKVKGVQWNQLLGSNSNFCFPLKPRMAFEWKKEFFHSVCSKWQLKQCHMTSRVSEA